MGDVDTLLAENGEGDATGENSDPGVGEDIDVDEGRRLLEARGEVEPGGVLDLEPLWCFIADRSGTESVECETFIVVEDEILVGATSAGRRRRPLPAHDRKPRLATAPFNFDAHHVFSCFHPFWRFYSRT